MSYDLSAAADDLRSGSTSRFSIFAEGVKSKYMKAWNQDIYVRFLPAFDAAKTGYVPCHTPENRLAPFLRLVPVWDQIGHGDFKGRRRFVSPKAWGDDEYDPVDELNNFIRANGCWSYLNQSEGNEPNNPNRKIPAPLTKKPKVIVIGNVIDVYNQAEGVVLGEFSVSVFHSMISANGVLKAINTMVTDEQIRQNYLWRYANGDITDPTHGPVLRIGKSPDAKGYSVSVALDNTNNVLRFNTAQFLGHRYDLENLDSIVPRKGEADIIQILLDTLNQRSPSGVHEWEMLKAVFGSRHNIPNPPEMTGRPNPVTQNAQQGLGPNPAQAPGMQAPAGAPGMMPPPPAAGQIPGLQSAPPAQQPPVQQPPVQQQYQQQPPVQQQMAPPPPVQQPPVQQQYQQQPPVQQQMAPPPQQPMAGGAQQPIPGAPPATDDRTAFMNKILNKGQ